MIIEKIKKILYKTAIGSSVMSDLNNYAECDGLEITPERILEELEYLLYKVEQDGYEYHLENPQQVRSLKNLINKVKLEISK